MSYSLKVLNLSSFVLSAGKNESDYNIINNPKYGDKQMSLEFVITPEVTMCTSEQWNGLQKSILSAMKYGLWVDETICTGLVENKLRKNVKYE